MLAKDGPQHRPQVTVVAGGGRQGTSYSPFFPRLSPQNLETKPALSITFTLAEHPGVRGVTSLSLRPPFVNGADHLYFLGDDRCKACSR